MSLWKTISAETRLLQHQLRAIMTTSTRSFESKKHNPSPTCQSKSKGKKADTECVDDHPKPRRREDIEETFPFYDLIKFKVECCGAECVDKDFPSFDKCLYKETDKNKRKYQVTWVECPPLKIKPKKICCTAEVTHPPIVRRKPAEKPDTACQLEQPCAPQGELKCPRIKMPHCRPVRVPVRCHRVRWPSECRKVKAPYPAFSECARAKLRVKRRTECECLEEISTCHLLGYLNRRLRQTGTMQLNPCKNK
ncbi:hypothetical protein ACLKA6_006499 [Drosophila palustris]